MSSAPTNKNQGPQIVDGNDGHVNAESRGVSRRAVAVAGAWSVPAITLAVASPAAAASPEVTALTVTFDAATFDAVPHATITNLGLLVQKVTRASAPAAGATVSLEISEITPGTPLPPEVEETVTGDDVAATFAGGALTATTVTDSLGRAVAPVITIGAGYGVLQVTATVTHGGMTASESAFIRVQSPAGGQLWAWGHPLNNALGNGNSHVQPVPALVDYSGEAIISMGEYHAASTPAFIDAIGDIYVWGTAPGVGGNGQGHMHNNESYPKPKYVYSPRKYKSIAKTTLDIFYAISVDGGIYRWGQGLYTPTLYSSDLATGVKKVAVGPNQSFALKSDGTMWSWGFSTSYGLGLGDGPEVRYVMGPTKITFPAGAGRIIDFAATKEAAIAVDDRGDLYSWGPAVPARESDPAAFRSQAVIKAYAGDQRGCVLKPVRVNAASDRGYVSVHCHPDSNEVVDFERSTCIVARKSDGTAKYSGHFKNDLGFAVSREHALEDVGLTGISSITMGKDTVYAVRTDGTVWARGSGLVGQIGNGVSQHATTWTKVALPAKAKARSVHATWMTTYAVTNKV